ncbi:MAG: Cof-type HAD-IIB family hydrolase [Mycoplasma sp.]
MDYKLLAIDLDGTLLTKVKTIDPIDLKAIKKFSDAKAIPFIATGRAWASAKRYVEEVEKITGKKSPFTVCFSGALILDENRKAVYHKLVPTNIVQNIVAYCERHGLKVWVYTKSAVQRDGVLINSALFRLWCRLVERMNAYKLNENDQDFSSFKLNVWSSSKTKFRTFVNWLKQKYSNNIDFFITGKRDMEIVAKGLSKGEAIGYVAKQLNINLRETAAIGDSGNDVSMTKFARTSASVGNSSKELVAEASINLKSHRHAVADFINNHLMKTSYHKIKVLATDLDGTLLNDDKVIDKKTILKIQDHLGKTFDYFVISTGRNVPICDSILKKLGLKSNKNCFFVSNNGMIVYDINQHQTIHFKPINHAVATTIFNFIVNSHKKIEIATSIHHFDQVKLAKLLKANRHTEYNISTYNKDFFIKQIKKWAPKFFNEYNPETVYNNIDTMEGINNVSKFVVYFNSKTERDNWIKEFEQLNLPVTVTSSGDLNLEINKKGVSKATGLKNLAQYLNIDQNQILAVGDERNDISMLKMTDWSYTLTDSKEIVKQMAKHVLESKPSQIVSDAIDDYIKLTKGKNK